MKELSIEEKYYEVYTELINRLEDVKNAIKKQNYGIAMDILYKPYPEFQITTSTELKESDNERIRKEIIDFLKLPHPQFVGKRDHEKWIAWLEKQISQDNAEDVDILNRFSFYSYKDEPNVLYLSGVYVNEEYRNKGIGTKILEVADEVAKSLNCHAIRLKTKKDSDAERLYRTHAYNSLATEDKDEIWLEKPVDKVEPEFKVGDWCIDNEDGTIFQIVEVLHNTYTYKTIEGQEYSCTHYSLENDARLWNIQDAKGGDTLAFMDGTSGILLYKENTKNFGVLSYCRIIRNSFIDKEESGWGSRLLFPATKEQRDLLFQKMKKAGYEWDAEKKELKKRNLFP